ncbi:MAG: hypothetical protein U5K69_29415 [Balneolaceae bacterium]|nr:hypothetical protein [Balneolaceae bacterium]
MNRTQAAFPELTSTHAKVIAGDNAVAEKLNEDHEIEPDEIAEGSWKSIIEKIEKLKTKI